MRNSLGLKLQISRSEPAELWLRHGLDTVRVRFTASVTAML
jgi:hypothetical protein